MFTLTPSAFLLLPLFPPERGMSTKRKRSKMVKKNGTKAEKKRDGIVVPTNAARWKKHLIQSTAKINKVRSTEQKRPWKNGLWSFPKFPLIGQLLDWLSVSLTEADRQVKDSQLRAEANFSLRPETFRSPMVGNSPSFLVTWPQHHIVNQWKLSVLHSTFKVWWVMESVRPCQSVYAALPLVNISDTEQVRPACLATMASQLIQTSPFLCSWLQSIDWLLLMR